MAGGLAAIVLLISSLTHPPARDLVLPAAHSWVVYSHSKGGNEDCSFFFSFFFFLSHASQSLWNLSSLTEDWTWAKAAKARILATRPPGNTEGCSFLNVLGLWVEGPAFFFGGCGTSGQKELQRDMSGCVSLLGTPFWPHCDCRIGAKLLPVAFVFPCVLIPNEQCSLLPHLPSSPCWSLVLVPAVEVVVLGILLLADTQWLMAIFFLLC